MKCGQEPLGSAMQARKKDVAGGWVEKRSLISIKDNTWVQVNIPFINFKAYTSIFKPYQKTQVETI